MHSRDIQLVRDSLAHLGDPRAFGLSFYETLFALRPDLRALFSTHLDVQAAKLADMLAAVVGHLDAGMLFPRDCATLGQRHATYGVQEDDYDDAGAALLQTLHKTFGDAFTAELEQAWAAVYGEIAEAMIAASRGTSA